MFTTYGFSQKLFGSHSDHELKKIYPIVDKIEALEPTYAAMSAEELRAQTDLFKERYQNGEDLDDMLPEAFAVAREACSRVLKMRPSASSSSAASSCIRGVSPR